jgi:predicted Zn-dependent protease
LLAFANNEAELASVLAHEMGHVTARHISERYSQSTLTQLGATALSIGIGSAAANQLINTGASMYLSSYSRSQESEADDLGIRYLSRAGYDPNAMASFLATLQRSSALEAAEQGEQYKEMRNIMATHPMTSDRVARARIMAANYPPNNTLGIESHLKAITGLVYGDTPKDGFVRGQEFVHPALGFAFAVPQGFRVKNLPDKVIGQARSKTGATFIFDVAQKPYGMQPTDYIQQSWTRGASNLEGLQTMDVNGMNAATAQVQGNINGQAALIRLVAIEWSPNEVYRFQFVMPQATSNAEIEALKRVSYSLRALSRSERQNISPKRVAIITGSAGDSVSSLARRMAFDDNLNEQRFLAINGMDSGAPITPGRKYKIVVE